MTWDARVCHALRLSNTFSGRGDTISAKAAESHNLHTAVKETVRECIREGILAEYLMKQRGDIMSILEVDLTLEERDAIRMEDGYAFGMKDGIAQEKKAIILQMLKKGMDRELIKEITDADDALIDELSSV